MAHPMTAAGVLSKNALASADTWVILVEIDATALLGGILRYTSDMSVLTWGTTPQPYYVMAMSFGDVQENLQGGLPRVDMRLSNLDVNLNAAMNAYDGLRGAVVTVRVIPYDNRAANEAELTEVFVVLETVADNQWITFTLGFADPLSRRFPRDRYTATSCRHRYRLTRYAVGTGLPVVTPFCRFIGPEPVGPPVQTTCDHTLKHCIDRGNTAQFGGSPGVDEGVYQ